MFPFPSINQFRQVVSRVRSNAAFLGLNAAGEPMYNPAPVFPKLRFKGTVKLHGTNGAIVFSPEGMYFQSRTRVLTAEADNAGFYAHMSQYTEALLALRQLISTDPNDTVVIYGEWCGGNIQKGVALSELKKMFVIFAVKVNETWLKEPIDFTHEEAAIYSTAHFTNFELDIDFEHPERAQEHLARITAEVEARCPAGMKFGVNGIGEGVVWRCLDDPSPDLWFKVKGEKHSVSKVKTLASVNVEAIEKIQDFVDMVVTEERLNQGLNYLRNEQLKPFDTTSIGDFIRWVHSDILKEEADTIEANGFDPKKLGGPIALKAKRWYFQQLNNETFV